MQELLLVTKEENKLTYESREKHWKQEPLQDKLDEGWKITSVTHISNDQGIGHYRAYKCWVLIEKED